ncbi:MAG TPA: NADH-quinone oxidoreductase subunit J [Chryseolinea sp.]|nr:NADH-quinone oxidoreductase subunit J [Chryseolinea sp.]
MNLHSTIFYLFEALAVISAIALIFTRNVFHGALMLIGTLLAIAGIYVMAFAEFLAVTQILVYAGGILVVIIFGTMLTTKLSGKPLAVANGNQLPGVLAGAGLFTLLIYFLSKEFSFDVAPPRIASLDELGIGLMTSYALPFEVVGIVLLIALVGAAVIASTLPSKDS